MAEIIGPNNSVDKNLIIEKGRILQNFHDPEYQEFTGKALQSFYQKQLSH